MLGFRLALGGEALLPLDLGPKPRRLQGGLSPDVLELGNHPGFELGCALQLRGGLALGFLQTADSRDVQLLTCVLPRRRLLLQLVQAVRKPGLGRRGRLLAFFGQQTLGAHRTCLRVGQCLRRRLGPPLRRGELALQSRVQLGRLPFPC